MFKLHEILLILAVVFMSSMVIGLLYDKKVLQEKIYSLEQEIELQKIICTEK